MAKKLTLQEFFERLANEKQLEQNRCLNIVDEAIKQYHKDNPAYCHENPEGTLDILYWIRKKISE